MKAPQIIFFIKFSEFNSSVLLSSDFFGAEKQNYFPHMVLSAQATWVFASVTLDMAEMERCHFGLAKTSWISLKLI